MITLTDDQLETLESELISAGLHRQSLYHDLLDHYYCLTTRYMEDGHAFGVARTMAFAELAPDGFAGIEHDVLFFLQFNINLRMNRVLYLGALVASVGQSLYVLFRNQQWPGASFMLLMGCGALFLMVVPILLWQFTTRFSAMSVAKRIQFGTGLLAICLFAMGSAFKVLHFPAANIQLVLGTGMLALVFFPLYFLEQYRKAVSESVIG